MARRRQGHYENYTVPQRESQTVLDVVTYVQRHIDPTLSYRFACRVGVCGSCAMTVNGQPRWTCRTHVAKVAVGGRLEIGPLENLPVIKDLTTDMQPFFEKWQQAKGVFEPSKTRARRHRADPAGQPGAHRPPTPAIECINCGVCYSACDTVRWNAEYLGPAALNARLDAGQRRARCRQRRAACKPIAAAGGCHACHSHQSCQELCPQALNPTASIAGLKRRTAAAYLKGEIGACKA